MDSSDMRLPRRVTPVSDQALRAIAEQGFFSTQGCLADARSACAELLLARALIDAQNVTIAQLTLRVTRAA